MKPEKRKQPASNQIKLTQKIRSTNLIINKKFSSINIINAQNPARTHPNSENKLNSTNLHEKTQPIKQLANSFKFHKNQPSSDTSVYIEPITQIFWCKQPHTQLVLIRNTQYKII